MKEGKPTKSTPVMGRSKLPAPLRTFARALRHNTAMQVSLILLVAMAIAGVILFMPKTRQASTSKIGSLTGATDLNTCRGSENQFKCYEGYYQRLTFEKDPKAAFQDMRREYDKDTYIVGQCHQMGHIVGRAGMKKYGDITQAFDKGDSFCSSGYHHGVVEQAIGDVGVDNIKRDINKLCDKIAARARYSLDHHNCTHGLGHGLYTVANTDPFKGIKDCDLLDDSWEQSSCHGGVFMENLMVPERGGTTPYLHPEDPLYPCTAVEANYKNGCYLIQTSYALRVKGYNFAETFKVCAATPDEAWKGICYQSIGRDASGSTYAKVDGTKANCEQAFDEFSLTNCIVGAVRDMIWYHYDDKDAKKLCGMYNGQIRETCLGEAASYYSTLNKT